MEEGRGGAGAWVGWEEVVVSNDRGRREVHYYLKRDGDDGAADLAVVGREKSVRHMSYTAPAQFLRTLRASAAVSYASSPPSAATPGPGLRWKSRREVIDWLSALVSDSHTYGSAPMVDTYSDDEDYDPEDNSGSKDLSSGNMEHISKEFSWLGSAWTCRKRRKHHRSFCRNGITISVHDFVYIMAEEHRRLVAYVEDLYEDTKGNRMVVVRWFHKVDEVGTVLPPDISDREIFFSLCLQDFSVECIDGLATVLSALHYEKFWNERMRGPWEPYLCRRQIDNDDVKPFDITQVQGYWSQALLRSMFSSSLKLRLKLPHGGSSSDGDGNGCHSRFGFDMNTLLNSGVATVSDTAKNTNINETLCDGVKGEKHASSAICYPLFGKKLWKQRAQQQELSLGCHVEVLSQDSGIRGCWFRCVVLKRHHDKLKVQYLDVQDADETGNLEEWILASRVATPDKLDIRMSKRPAVRPHSSCRGMFSSSVGVGAIVDAWWHDGWWEGIVIDNSSEQEIHVYFPGEQRISVFGKGDLRHSQDWVCNRWNDIEDKPEIVTAFLADLKPGNRGKLNDECFPCEAPVPPTLHDNTDPKRISTPLDGNIASNPSAGDIVVPNLVDDCMLGRLKWSSSKKRKRARLLTTSGSEHKRQCDGSSISGRGETVEERSGNERFVLTVDLLDHENCKVGGDPLFSPPVTLSSLVMSR